MKPRPSLPIIFSAGTSAFSNVIEFVVLPFIPSFFSAGPIIIPGVSASTTKPVIPFSVRANTDIKSAIPAFVIQILEPFKIHLLPFFLASVFKLNVSEPASGSVRAKQAIISPEQSLGRYLFFNSSDPPTNIALVPID